MLHHRKTIRRFHEPGHLHELTFSCYRRMPRLTNDDWRRRLARSIDRAAESEQVELLAFVFMPEHVHLLVNPLGPGESIGRFLAALKRPFSKEIKTILVESQAPLIEQLTVQERPGKRCFRFWQEGPGFDRNLHSPKAIAASIDYIHSNPVKRNLCRSAMDWKWSSARYFLSGTAIDPDLPILRPVPAGAVG